MSNTLKWTNPNVAFDEVQIYRSEVKPVLGEIPTNKVATITDGSTTWTDSTAALNKYYWYWIAVKKGEEIVYGYPHMAINMPYTGPGPQELKTGDWSRGYFGTVTSVDFFTNQELINWLGVGSLYNITHFWYKFVLDGKILFFPDRYVGSGLSWNTLYAQGVLYGVDGPGPSPSAHGLPQVNQKRVITKGEHSFVVRIPRCQSTPDWSWVQRYDYASEWFLTMAAAVGAGNPAPALDLADNSAASFNGACTFAEFVGANAAYMGASMVVNSPATTGARTAGLQWRPVLELVLL